MALTTAATPALTQLTKSVGYTLELRTNHAESATWLRIPLERRSLSLVFSAGAPAKLTVDVIDAELAQRLDADPANRLQRYAPARLAVSVGGESEYLLQGRVQELKFSGPRVSLTIEDWSVLANECDCEIDAEPDTVAVVAASATRQLSLIAENAYGFTADGSGSDPAFQAANQAARRSWAPDEIRIWRDAAQAEEVPPAHCKIYTASGLVKILEDTSGKTYYASGVTAYLESAAPGATDVDYATLLRAAFMQQLGAGGTGLTAADLDIPPTGFDLAAPLRFEGSLRDLIEDVLARVLPHCRYWFNSATGQHTIRPVIQAPRGSEQWTLLAAQRVTQPRSTRQQATRVAVTGKDDQPRNLLTLPETVWTPGASGTYFIWDRLSGGTNGVAFAEAIAKLTDGEASAGIGLHNLSGSLAELYSDSDWRVLGTADAQAAYPVDAIRAVLPPTFNRCGTNPRHPDEPVARFWPGLRLLLSLDGVRWRLASPRICGRLQPASTVEVQGDDLLTRRARYVRVLCLPFKQGTSNHHDPALGLLELEVLTSLDYKIVREIDPAASPATYYTYTDGRTWRRNHPGLAARLGGRHKTIRRDLGNQYSEYRAQDVALQTLAEAVRPFPQVEYQAVCDPRVRLYQTVAVPDRYNGGVPGVLVEGVELRPGGTVIKGTDYLAEEDA